MATTSDSTLDPLPWASAPWPRWHRDSASEVWWTLEMITGHSCGLKANAFGYWMPMLQSAPRDRGIIFSSDVSARGLDYPDVTAVIQARVESESRICGS